MLLLILYLLLLMYFYLQKTRITKYKCDFDNFDPETNRVHLNVGDLFKQSVSCVQ